MLNAYNCPLHVYTPNDEHFDFESDWMATRLYKAAEKQDYRELSRAELMAFLDRAAAVQDTQTGLLKLCIDDTMPGDMRVYLWYNPTYAAAAAGIYAWLHCPEDFDESRTRFLRTLLHGAIGRGLSGHGLDGLSDFLRNMTLLAQAGLQEFLTRGAAGAVDFQSFVKDKIQQMRQDVEHANQHHTVLMSNHSMLPTACQAEIECLLAMYDGKMHPVFVYGTLMRAQSAAGLMKTAVFCDNAALRGYAMYDLGDFPGIVPAKGKTVLGELWFVDDETMAELDDYEDEGSLYRRTQVRVSGRKGECSAMAYVYLGTVQGTPLWNKWGSKLEDPVWYAGYGSNLCSARFQCYIQGGFCPDNGRNYSGCKDKTLWCASDVAWMPGTLYFGSHSSSWNSSVAFLKPDQGTTLYKVYRITWGQLMDVRKQEGPGPNWYGRVVFLQFSEKDGAPVFTLTSEELQPLNRPSDDYLKVVVRALKEEVGLSEKEIARYLWDALRCGKKLLLRDVQQKVVALAVPHVADEKKGQ